MAPKPSAALMILEQPVRKMDLSECRQIIGNSMLLLAYLPLFIYIYFPTPVYLAILIVLIDIAARQRAAKPKIIVALFIIIPGALWLYAYWENRQKAEAFQETIADIPKAAVPAVLPDMMLVYNTDFLGVRRQDFSLLSCANGTIGQHSAADKAKPTRKKSIKDIQPSDRYFIFDLRYPNPLSGPPTNRAAGQGPFELNFVESGKKQIIAFRYAPFLPTPYPILTSFGWYRSSNSASDTTASINAINFLRESIGKCIDLEVYFVNSSGEFYWSNMDD